MRFALVQSRIFPDKRGFLPSSLRTKRIDLAHKSTLSTLLSTDLSTIEAKCAEYAETIAAISIEVGFPLRIVRVGESFTAAALRVFGILFRPSYL